MKETFIQLCASVLGLCIVGGLFLFTSFGRSESDTFTLKLSDSLVLTGNTIVNLFYILLIIICAVATLFSLYRLIGSE